MTAPEIRLNGLVAATFTAFAADGTLSLAPIEAYAALLARNGVSGVFVCGTTGEGVSMTTAERMENLGRWCDVARGSLKIVAHVGHNSLPDARALAAHAARAGVDAIGTVAPSVLRPAALDDLVDWCAAVAAAAPETPYFYYHIPVLTGVRHDMVRFCERATARIPTFAGLKFTDYDLFTLSLLIREGSIVLNGRDEVLSAGLLMGAQGGIGSIYNLVPDCFVDLYRHARAGRWAQARETQDRINDLIAVLLRFPFMPALKRALEWEGIACGEPLRPRIPLSGEQESQLRSALKPVLLDRPVPVAPRS